jgi:hypothetical protein
MVQPLALPPEGVRRVERTWELSFAEDGLAEVQEESGVDGRG